MSRSPYAIEARDIVKSFPKQKRLREVLLHPFSREKVTALMGADLKVEPGELFGLLGPNGAGKTTLIKIFCTLILPNTGEAWVAGYPISQSKAIRHRIAYVISEERSFYWRLTGRQNLEFFAALYDMLPKEAKRRISEALEIVGLSSEADRMFKDYSTGMRQRLAIARGLLMDPEIFFMDEPTRSLDPEATQQFHQFILQELIMRRQKTVFLSTHDLAEAELCHRIAILDRGKVRACGTPREIKSLSNKCRYRVKLQNLELDYQALLAPIEGIIKLERLATNSQPYTELALEINPQLSPIWRITEHLVEADARLLSCFQEEISLGEVFHRLLESDPSENLSY